GPASRGHARPDRGDLELLRRWNRGERLGDARRVPGSGLAGKLCGADGLSDRGSGNGSGAPLDPAAPAERHTPGDDTWVRPALPALDRAVPQGGARHRALSAVDGRRRGGRVSARVTLYVWYLPARPGPGRSPSAAQARPPGDPNSSGPVREGRAA